MISVIIYFAVVGFLTWLLTTYIPMDDKIKKVIVIFVIVCMVFYLINLFGGVDFPIPHLPRGK